MKRNELRARPPTDSQADPTKYDTMVSSEENFDYLKANLEKIGKSIDQYMRYLESEGKTPGGLKRTDYCLNIFFTHAQTTEPSEEQFKNVRDRLREHGYVPKLEKEILVTAGKFYKYLCKIDPYDKIRVKRNVRWYRVPITEIPFDDELESFYQYLDKEPMNPVVRKRHKDHIVKVLRILCYEKHVESVSDIDVGCFELLLKYLENSSYVIRHQVLNSLGMFVRFHTEKDIYAEYRRKRDIKNEFENSDEWKEWMGCMERYVEHSRKCGYTDISVRSMRLNITTDVRRLFSIIGPIYPADVDEETFFRFREGSKDVKDITIKKALGYIGRLLKFIFGRNPMDRTWMYWSKQEPDRTWIFKNEWKSIYSSATDTEKVVLLLGAGMGLRHNEMAQLKLSDIEGDVMTIRGKGHGQGKIVKKEMPRSVLCAIEDYLPERDAIIKKYGDRYEGSLIQPPYYSNGKNAVYRYIDELMAAAVKRVGKKASCHTLRRFYCTNLIDNGFELDTVRRMMRHSSIDTTLIYVNSDPRKLKSATDSVDDALFG